MKKIILGLIFVVAMAINLTNATGMNDWKCMNAYIWCGPGEIGHMALVCGDNGTARYNQFREWQSLLCESIP